MCMKKIDAEKIYFDKLTGLSHFTSFQFAWGGGGGEGEPSKSYVLPSFILSVNCNAVSINTS